MDNDEGRGPGPWHAFEEHVGEVCLRIFAPSMGAMLTEAGRAIAELQVGDEGFEAEGGTDLAVRVKARDPAALLVAWLNELIFLGETRGEVFRSLVVDEATDTAVSARIVGARPRALKTAVKAATYHAAAVARTAQGVEATVVLDV